MEKNKYAPETEILQLLAVGNHPDSWHYIPFRLEYRKILQAVWNADLAFLCTFSSLSGGCLLFPQATREFKFTLFLCVYSLENIKPTFRKEADKLCHLEP